MKLSTTSLRQSRRSAQRSGSVLVIVLWIALGLVSVALYFSHSMSLELRAADNRAAALEAGQAIEGAARFVTNLLANQLTNGIIPDPYTYSNANVQVGDATFWLIGRDNLRTNQNQNLLSFGLIDESAKLNLNTATIDMLVNLPGMTPEFAAAIIDWRDSDGEVTSGGAEDETYSRRTPPYRTKNAKFESVDELRLVAGADVDILYGEDANLNGILDPNEDDADANPPSDNHNGKLDPGIFDYVTVYSREPNTMADGSAKMNIAIPLATNTLRGLQLFLSTNFDNGRAGAMIAQLTSSGAGRPCQSALEFYLRSGMTPDEFAKIANMITATNGDYVEGLINISTASPEVLGCIPGIGTNNAATVVTFRQTQTDLSNVSWLAQAIDRASAIQAGPYITARSYQFTADVAALGHHSRGYQRVKFVFDTSDGTPRIIYRQDLTHLGWALGTNLYQRTLLAEKIP